MPVRIDIIDFKCFNQLRNGEAFDRNLSEFTPNLVGNIAERVKVEYTANIEQSANTEDNDEWFIINDPSFKQIERSSGSFLDDNIQVGDVYQFYADWENRRSGSPEYTGTVDFISSDGKILRYTVDSGTDSTSGTVDNKGLAFVLSEAPVSVFEPNFNTALFAKFGLLENSETFNFLSKTTEAQQVYYVGELVRADPAKDAESLGTIKDWVTGSMTVEFTGNQPDFLGAQYIITHEFVLNPFYILSFRQFIENGTIPALLAGDSSIKYAVELEFRKTLTDTGSSKIGDFAGLPGFVGWYGENFNGLNKKYEVISVAYEEAVSTDPLEGVNINTSTKATITVSNLDGAITDYSCSVYIFRVPDSEDDYIGTTSDLIENFLLKSEIVSNPDTTSPNVTTSTVSGDLVIEYTIDYSTAEKLQLSTDDEYILLVQVEDPNISAGNSDRVMLLVDFRNYVDVDFLAEFIEVDAYGFLTPGQTLDDAKTSSPIASNEDGLFLDAIFGSNTTRNVVINSIDVNLIAYNEVENKSFELDNYSFNLGPNPVFSGGVQQIEVDTTRGYPLLAGDIFNRVRVTTEEQDGDYRNYRLQFGQKITWQDWIFNPRVDNEFFNSGFPNNNLNEKSSNYSGELGYEIKIALVINVTGVDDLGRTLTGDFINFGGSITVNDYEESEDGVSGVIQTFDLETNQSLEGNILYNGKDTLFRAVFQDASLMTYAIHRIEPSQNQGDGILEISDFADPAPTNLLKPLDGETRLKVENIAGVLTSECLIDGSKIQEGVSYKLSARTGIGEPPFNFGNWKVRFDSVNDFADHVLAAERTTDTSLTWWFWVEYNAAIPDDGTQNMFVHQNAALTVRRRLRTTAVGDPANFFQANSFPPVPGSSASPTPIAYSIGDRVLILLRYSGNEWEVQTQSPSDSTFIGASLPITPIELGRIRLGTFPMDLLEAGIIYDAPALSVSTNPLFPELYNGGNGIDIDDHSVYGPLEKTHWKIDEGSGLFLADSGDTNYGLNMSNFTGSFWIPV